MFKVINSHPDPIINAKLQLLLIATKKLQLLFLRNFVFHKKRFSRYYAEMFNSIN